MGGGSENYTQIRAEAALSGILALMAADREADGRPVAVKTEVVLATAGLTYEEIAAVTGKKVGAVRKSVERAGKKAGGP
jgi:DNA-directed RNA polymerase specialized sigma24 family protein